MYIVRGEPREGYGAVIVTKMTRRDAFATAVDFSGSGHPGLHDHRQQRPNLYG
jgi:hypothetical protein